MPQQQACLVCFFSGTGNSRRAATLVSEAFAASGREVRLVDMEDQEPAGLETQDHLLVLVFPAYSWAPPALVLRWIRGLGRSGRRRNGLSAGPVAAVLAVDGGDGGAAAGTARRCLERRGYRVPLSSRTAYPDNWRQMMPPPSGDKAAARVAAGDEGARSFAADLIAGRQARRRSRPFLGFLGLVVGPAFRSAGRRALSMFFVADDRCTSCRLCERSCPVGAIHMKSGGGSSRPRWSVRCEACNRCINICPFDAIVTSTARVIATLTLMGVALVGCALLAGSLFDAATVGSALGAAGSVLRFAAVVGGLAAGQWIFLFAGPLILRGLFALPGLRRLEKSSFNGRWARYTAPGFRAPLRRD